MDPAIERRRWRILGVLVLSLLVVVLDTSILNVALRRLSEPKPAGLGTTQGELEWILNAYTLAFAGLLFTWGVLGDRVGRKTMLLAGMAAFGTFSALSAFAQTPGELIAARALMGVSGAAVMPSTLSIISNVFDPAERPRAIAIWSGAVGVAIAIGPVVGGLLLDHFWWGSVFLVNVPICAVAVALMIAWVPNSRNPRPGRLDPIGVGLSVVGIVAFVFGVIRGADGWGQPVVWLAIAGGIGLLAAFVAWERRAPNPVLDLDLFRIPQFSAALSLTWFVFFALMGEFFFLVFYLQAARGLSPLQAGLSLLPLAVGQLALSSRSPRLVARFGANRVTAGGMALMAASYAFFIAARATTPTWALELSLFAQGVGLACVTPPTTATVMAAVPREKAGAGSAIGNTMRQVGGAVGVAVFGTILASIYRAHITPTLRALAPLGRDHALMQSVSASISATQAYASSAGANVATRLADPAISSFTAAMHIVALAAVALGLVGSLVALRWLPRRAAPRGADASPASARGRAAEQPQPALR
jgi:EmrB/QacA subfamily drug resistance transporter